MSDAIQKRAGFPKVVSGKAALDALRAAANSQKVTGELLQEDLVLCIDGSSSMLESAKVGKGGRKINDVIDAAHGLVRASESSLCKMGLVLYADRAQVLCNITDNYRSFDANVDQIRADGWTNIGLGLQSCGEMLGKKTAKRVKRIVLLTDGIEANTAGPKAMEVVDRYLVPLGIVVDCVAFGDDADVELLKEIAKKTGGNIYTADEAESLSKTFLKLESGARGFLASNNP